MNIKLHSSRFQHSFYTKAGQGFPIILLHGFAEDARIWKYQLPFLQQHFTCLVPDLPGSGRSFLPSEKMSMELMADFVLEILVQENIDECILLGHSMGGYIALAFAEKYPEKLAGFGLIHSTALADDATKKENRRKSIKLIENNGREIFLNAMIPNLYSDTSKQKLQDEIAFHLSAALETPSENLTAYYQAMIDRPDRTEVLKSFQKPVLLVLGTEDTAVPIAQGLSISYLNSFTQLKILEETGHTGMLENSESVNSILNSFCKCVLDMKNR